MGPDGTAEDIGLFDEQAPDARELLVRFGAEILEKSFPPTEYVPNCFVGSGPLTDPFLVACAPDGTILGGACGEVYPHSNSLLLGYLAVRQGLRGTGVGGLLMRELRERWVRPGQLALLEIDDPRHHAVRDDYGDPTARARFYDRFGVRGLAVPYFQPRLGPALPRGYHMILSAMALPEGGDAVAGSAVRAFLEEYFLGCEGTIDPGDEDLQWMLEACDVPQIAAVPLDELDRIPDAEPPSRAGAA